MAQSIFDMLPMPAPRAAQSMAQAMTATELDDDEAGEAAIEAIPRLDRSVVGYLDARKGIDGEKYFGACGSCMNYIPEGFMRGAVRGSRCSLLGSNFPVNDDSSCNGYSPWPDGQPDGDDLADGAEDMIAGCRGSATPSALGFVWDKCKSCSTCKFYDAAESDCEFLEALNTALPNVFAVDVNVVLPAKCSAWQEIPSALEEMD